MGFWFAEEYGDLNKDIRNPPGFILLSFTLP